MCLKGNARDGTPIALSSFTPRPELCGIAKEHSLCLGTLSVSTSKQPSKGLEAGRFVWIAGEVRIWRVFRRLPSTLQVLQVSIFYTKSSVFLSSILALAKARICGSSQSLVVVQKAAIAI